MGHGHLCHAACLACTTAPCKNLQINGLVEGGTANIPAMLQPLQQLCMLLGRELSTIGSANTDAMDGSRPHIKGCLNNLHALEAIMDLEPRHVTVQYSAQAQVGVWHSGAVEGCWGGASAGI